MLSHLSRGISRRRQTLHLRPISNLTKDHPHDAWVATGPNPCFELEPSNGAWPSGWVLLDSTLLRRASDFSARLYFDTGSGFSEQESMPIPASSKGMIHEVVYFPPGIRCVHWVPMRSEGIIEQDNFRLTEIGSVERAYRMLRRAAPALLKHPQKKREAVGLSLQSLLLDLQKAYAASSRLRALAPAPSYAEWLGRASALADEDRRLVERRIGGFSVPPRFTVLTVAVKEDSTLARTRDSLNKQSYSGFDMQVQEGGASGAVTLKVANKDFVICVHAGDEMAEHALFWMACIIEKNPDVGLIYSDEDRIDDAGVRCEPEFKPDWSPELLRSTNYIGRFAAIRADVLQQAGGLNARDIEDNHSLLLRVTELLEAGQIVHIPAVLFHRWGKESVLDTEAVRHHFLKTEAVAAVDVIKPGCYHLRYRLPQPLPMVSIVIPTRDAPELIQLCVDSILQKSTYPNYEIIVVDNQSANPQALAYLDAISKDSRVRVLYYDAPFNFSAINNFAAQQARGDVLCLLNNDTEVISPDWMGEMLGHLLQDKVGVVGAKLLYPDGYVQHAGDVVGVGGVANHLHAFVGRNDAGYCNRAMLAQDLSAVTAACLMTWRQLYLELDGLDEKNLPVVFNDVDYCLRVREAGRCVVWTPHAELFHHESVSRGKDDTPQKKTRAKKEVSYMRKRWAHAMKGDPFYNPNLSYERPDFSLSHAPMVQKPWLT